MYIVRRYNTLTHNSKLHWICIAVIGLLYPISTDAQNLISNPDFEEFVACPSGPQGICQLLATGWSCPTAGSSDYFNACANPNPLTGVPMNFAGNQAAHAGVAYCGLLLAHNGSNTREYIMTMLDEPLIGGLCYYVSFYVTRGDVACPVEHVGAYFSAEDPTMNTILPLPYQPQVENLTGYMDDTDWELVSGWFVAEGGEQYMVIGNFLSDEETPYPPGCTNSGYYYIDDVSVIEGSLPEEIPLELGGPENACFSFEIDPDHDGPIFIWSNGANSPTIEVNASGTYTLTVTDGCNSGIDSIEVIIGGNNPPVDIGPQADTICTGQSYTIQLDPDLYNYEWQDGSTEADFEITTSGNYSVTLDDGCTSSSDEIDILVHDPPEPFSLGDDAILCAGTDIQFDFDASLGTFTWQDGSHNSMYTINDPGEYILTISNACGETSDDIFLTGLDAPEVNIPQDDYLLCSGDIVTIELDPGAGDILWQDGSDSPFYEISSGGDYAVTVTNECGNSSDQLTAIEVETPHLNLGQDLQLCEGDTVLLSPTLVEGEYHWQDNSAMTSYLVNTSGVYALTITNGCGEAIDSVMVSYTAAPATPDLGPDINLCAGEQIILHANNPGNNHLWQDMSTIDSLIVTQGGLYWIQVSNPCGMASDSIEITYSADPPNVQLPDTLSLCEGQGLILDAMVTGVSYLWNTSAITQQIAVTAPGMYSVTVTNSCGMDTDTTTINDSGPAPMVSLGNDIDLCPGESIDLIPVFTGVDTWIWHDGSMAPSFILTSGDTVSITASNVCGEARDTVIITELPTTPVLDLGPDTSLCYGQSVLLTINIPNVTVDWPDGSHAETYTVNTPGTVIATISDICGQSTDTMEIVGLPAIPTLDLGQDQTLCPGEVIVLAPGIAGVSYAWHDGSADTLYQSVQSETIILTISNACGTSTDTLEVTESTAGPQVDLGPDVFGCTGEMILVEAGISGVDYLWQDGSNAPQYLVTQSEMLVIQVSNNCGTDADTIEVHLDGIAPDVFLGHDTLLCDENTMLLYASTQVPADISWQDGSSGVTFLVSQPGTYYLLQTNACGEDRDTINVSFNTTPEPFSLGEDTLVCVDETVLLQVPDSSNDYIWQDGSNGTTYLVTQPGSYSVQVSNQCGSLSDTVVVSVDNNVPLLQLDTLLYWCIGEEIDLNAEQTFPATYVWSTGANTPSITVTAPGQYVISVYSHCGEASQDIDIVPDPTCRIMTGIYIPNIFSPNGDQVNDMFRAELGSDINLISMTGTIFDRWGDVIFSAAAIPFTWDGHFNGKAVLPGVYVYRLELTYITGGTERKEVLSGDVTVVR